MKKSLLLIGAALLTLSLSAQAQQRGNRGGNGDFGGGQNNQRGNRGGGNGGGVFPLPEGVENLVSVDAFNILLAQTNRDGRRDLSPIIVRHIYSGGIARLFGGTTIPTEEFVSPGVLNGGGGGSGVRGAGGNQNGGFGGAQGGNGGAGGFGGSSLGGGQTGGGFGGGGIGGAGNIGAFQMRPSAFRGRN